MASLIKSQILKHLSKWVQSIGMNNLHIHPLVMWIISIEYVLSFDSSPSKCWKCKVSLWMGCDMLWTWFRTTKNARSCDISSKFATYFVRCHPPVIYYDGSDPRALIMTDMGMGPYSGYWGYSQHTSLSGITGIAKSLHHSTMFTAVRERGRWEWAQGYSNFNIFVISYRFGCQHWRRDPISSGHRKVWGPPEDRFETSSTLLKTRGWRGL